MSDFSPAIFGLQGLTLSDEEAAFFHDVRPWGIILFARNIESRDQLRALTDDLREKSGNAHLPILIDQEGGQRSAAQATIGARLSANGAIWRTLRKR